jgi:hypothetical protein
MSTYESELRARIEREVVVPRSQVDEFFYDCLLKAVIDRRVELRSLVGD